jgi:hypothetical protein
MYKKIRGAGRAKPVGIAWAGWGHAVAEFYLGHFSGTSWAFPVLLTCEMVDRRDVRGSLLKLCHVKF